MSALGYITSMSPQGHTCEHSGTCQVMFKYTHPVPRGSWSPIPARCWCGGTAGCCARQSFPRGVLGAEWLCDGDCPRCLHRASPVRRATAGLGQSLCTMRCPHVCFGVPLASRCERRGFGPARLGLPPGWPRCSSAGARAASFPGNKDAGMQPSVPRAPARLPGGITTPAGSPRH